MSTSCVAATGGGEPTTTSYQQVPSGIPGLGIWLPRRKNEARADTKELPAATDSKAPTSFLKRVRVKMNSASRRAIPALSRPTESPTSDSEKTITNSDAQLTELEMQYIEYLRRAIGAGEFAHYRAPAV